MGKRKTTQTAQKLQVGSKQKVAIVAIVVTAFLLASGVSYLYQMNKNNRAENAAVTPAATAVVQLNADTTQVPLSSPFTVTLTLDSAQNAVDAADFVLTYDQNKLSAESVETGEFFKTYPVNSKSEGYIKVSGVAYFENNQLVIPQGRGVVARITFTPLKKGSTKILIDPDDTTIASAGKNILDSTRIKDLEIRVQ